MISMISPYHFDQMLIYGSSQICPHIYSHICIHDKLPNNVKYMTNSRIVSLKTTWLLPSRLLQRVWSFITTLNESPSFASTKLKWCHHEQDFHARFFENKYKNNIDTSIICRSNDNIYDRFYEYQFRESLNLDKIQVFSNDIWTLQRIVFTFTYIIILKFHGRSVFCCDIKIQLI